MKPFLWLSLIFALSSSSNAEDTFCGIIGDSLSSDCSCEESAEDEYGGTLTCSMELPDDADNLYMTVSMDPCADPMYAIFSAYDDDLGVSFTESYYADGDITEIPIEGMTLDLFFVDVQAEIAVSMEGDMDDLYVEVGIDVCEDVFWYGEECGANLFPEYFPIYIIQDTLDFGLHCASTSDAEEEEVVGVFPTPVPTKMPSLSQNKDSSSPLAYGSMTFSFIVFVVAACFGVGGAVLFYRCCYCGTDITQQSVRSKQADVEFTTIYKQQSFDIDKNQDSDNHQTENPHCRVSLSEPVKEVEVLQEVNDVSNVDATNL